MVRNNSCIAFRSVQASMLINGVDFNIEDTVLEIFKEYSKTPLMCVDITNKICKMIGALNVKAINNKGTRSVVRSAIQTLENKGLVSKVGRGSWQLVSGN